MQSCHQVAEISLLINYINIFALESTLQTWRAAIQDNSDRIRARDSEFFISHKPLRTWLMQYVSESRIDDLFKLIWTENSQEAIWAWLDALAL